MNTISALLLICLLIITFITNINAQLKTEYNLDFNEYKISLYIPALDRDYMFIININSNITYVDKFTMEETDVLTINKDKICVNKFTNFSGEIFYDSLYFSDESKHIKRMGFIFANAKPNYYKGLGLSYSYSDESFSFIHMLYRNNYIDKLSYAFDKSYMGNKHLIEYKDFYLGSLPRELIRGKDKIEIEVKEKDNIWNIDLREIYFGKMNNKLMSYNKLGGIYSYITLEDDRIYVPREVMDYIDTQMFGGYYNNHTCKHTKDDSKLFINCPCHISQDFPDFTFVIGENHIVFNGSQIFIPVQIDSICLFFIQYQADHNKGFMIGNSFIRPFITEFDIEEKKINLYSDRDVFFSEISFFGIMLNIKAVFIINILVLFLGIIIYFMYTLDIGGRATRSKKNKLFGY